MPWIADGPCVLLTADHQVRQEFVRPGIIPYQFYFYLFQSLEPIILNIISYIYSANKTICCSQPFMYSVPA